MARQKKSSVPEEERLALRNEWEKTARIPVHYGGYHSQWDLSSNEDVINMLVELQDWIIAKQLGQREVEQRLMAFDFETNEQAQPPARDVTDPASHPVSSGVSYKDVVSGFSATERKPHADAIGMAELKELYKICTAPAQPTTSLRAFTQKELRAMDLIIGGELEVPTVPPFLVNVLNKADLAAFESVFEHQSVYQIFAHIQPGYFLHGDCSHKRLVEFMPPPKTAAADLQTEAADFIRALSTIVYTEPQRLITFTFPSKQAAQRWVGWRVPLGNGRIELFNYAEMRKQVDEHGFHPVVRLDSYELTVLVLHREVSAEELLHLLDNVMKVPILNLQRVGRARGGTDSRAWKVQLTVPMWPVALKKYTHWKWLDVELAIFHHTVFVAPPCTTCRAFGHGHATCMQTDDEVAASRRRLTLDVAAASVGPTTKLHLFKPVQPIRDMADFLRARSLLTTEPTTTAAEEETEEETKAEPHCAENDPPECENTDDMDIDEVPNGSTAEEIPDEGRMHEAVPVDLRKEPKQGSEHGQDEPPSPAKGKRTHDPSMNTLGRPKGATQLARMAGI